MKIRGTAVHVAEKYVQLARDAQASGDRVAGEHYHQHAEHYFRIVAAAQAQQQQQAAQRSEQADERFDARANGVTAGNSGEVAAPEANPSAAAADDAQPINGSGTGESNAQPEPTTGDGGGDRPDSDSEARPPRSSRGPRGPRRRPPYRERPQRSDSAPLAADAPQPQPPAQTEAESETQSDAQAETKSRREPQDPPPVDDT